MINKHLTIIHSQKCQKSLAVISMVFSLCSSSTLLQIVIQKYKNMFLQSLLNYVLNTVPPYFLSFMKKVFIFQVEN